jgi:hypothetical protein
MVNGEVQMIEGEEARLRCISSSSKPKTDIQWAISGMLLGLWPIKDKNFEIGSNRSNF